MVKGSGDDRVAQAVKDAIESPLLETSINGAKAVLINVTGGYDLGMLAASLASSEIEKAADSNAIIIFGAAIKEEIKDEIFITVIATGFESRPSSEILGSSVIPGADEEKSKEDDNIDAILNGKEERDDSSSLINDDFKIPPFLASK